MYPKSTEIEINITLLLLILEEEEILDIIKSLNNKSTGPCSIPLKLSLIISDIIIIPLCHLINMSWDTGTYPDKLKIVKVISIHKGGCTQDLNNILPIFIYLLRKILYYIS